MVSQVRLGQVEARMQRELKVGCPPIAREEMLSSLRVGNAIAKAEMSSSMNGFQKENSKHSKWINLDTGYMIDTISTVMPSASPGHSQNVS
jgi:hypothetical protein